MDSTGGDGAFSPTDTASIALLRHLRAGGGDDVRFVHRIDVCDAPPEVLVAGLEPVPGTGLDDDGYSSVWYFYHAKKYTNKQGKLSGHRQRKVTGGGGASWHSEVSAKQVQGSGGGGAGTSCFLSYGRNTNPSARSIDRTGWCMREYDFADAAGNKQGDAGAASNYVLCKVCRTPRLKGKGKLASASSSCKNASSKQRPAKKKRKAGAGGGDHPEAPPAKLIKQQEPVHQEEVAVQPPAAGPGSDFNYNIEDLDFYVDESMPEPPGLLQQPPMLAAEACATGGMQTAVQPGTDSEHGDEEEEFTVERLLRGRTQPPIVDTPLGHGRAGGEFIQMPWGQVVPVVPETTVEDMLALGTETGCGQWSGSAMTTATSSIPPWSSYPPASSSSYAGCSSLLQGPDPLQLRYLTC